ncbi:MAG: hypothetical protein M1820_009188 [Bogoriella megaspora]|nr:MAG: hypothetical protein M1820_009188 [Bogoriella megaspora]
MGPLRPLLEKAFRSRSPAKAPETAAQNTETSSGEKHGLILLSEAGEGQVKGEFEVDIVAIHGLGGNNRLTWTDPSSGKLWLQDFLPSSLPGARVFSYGYPSEIAFGKSVAGVRHFALNLLAKLRLIIRDQALNIAYDRYPEVWVHSKGVVFFGTPHRGSSFAKPAKILGDIANVLLGRSGTRLFRGGINTDLLNTLKSGSEELLGVADTFTQRANALSIVTLYELQITPPLGNVIVPEVSAVIGVAHEERIPLYSNHRDMCRFDSPISQSYQLVAEILRKMANDVKAQRGKSGDSIDTGQSLDQGEKFCINQLNSIDMLGYQSRLDQRTEGTLVWVLKSPEYGNWLSTKGKRMLWITGYAGCGKTVLSSYIFQCLTETASPRSILCTFFFDGKIEQQHDPASFLRCLIYQIVSRRRKLLRLVRKRSDVQGMQLFGRFEALWDLFVELLHQESEVSVDIIMDGLDECHDRTQMVIVERIAHLLKSDISAQLKLLVTCRPNTPAIYALQNHKVECAWLQLESNTENISNDVRLVIQKRLEQLVQRGTCSSLEQHQLERILGSKADNTFLWISLVLQLLEQRRILTISDVEDAAERIPSDLTAVYDRYLELVPLEDRKLAGNTLRTIVTSTRPLNMEELQIAISLRMRSTYGKRSPLQNVQSVQTLLGPLIKVLDGKFHLVHQSLKEYLTDLVKREHDSLKARFGVDPEREALKMAGICMQYLTTDTQGSYSSSSLGGNDYSPTSPGADELAESQDLAKSEDRDQAFTLGYEDHLLFKEDTEVEIDQCSAYAEAHKFFDYAALTWAHHFAQGHALAGSDHHRAANELCDPKSACHAMWFRYFSLHNTTDEIFSGVQHPIVILSFFGLSVTLGRQIRTAQPGTSVIGKAIYGAAREGRSECLELLLEYMGASFKTDNCNVGQQSPLSAAAEFGHIDCVRVMSGSRLFTPNERDRRGRTALSLASGNGHKDIVEELLSDEATDPNLADKNGGTPISWAAVADAVDPLRRLLKHPKIVPDLSDRNGRSALSWAAGEGCLRAVDRLLKDKRVDVAKRDTQGWTPLMHAARQGQLEIVVKLIDSGRSKPDNRDVNLRNAASLAAEIQNYKILHKLHQSHPKTADVPDKDGWPPLAWALRPPGYPYNVKLLVQSKHVDINRKDNDGRSPISFAAGYGYADLTQLMIQTPEAELDSRDLTGRTPLSYAAGSGNTDVVALLLANEKIDPNSKDQSGRTPLSWAASAGHTATIHTLVRNPNVDSSMADGKGRSPLSYAESSGVPDAVLELQIRKP